MSEVSRNTGALEAVLFAAGDPLSEPDLAKILEVEPGTLRTLLTKLREELGSEGRGLTLLEVAGGWQLATRPELYHVVSRMGEVTEKKLSAPTMETLSIIAFKQPITKQEIEYIRGVRVERALAKLLSLELIAEVGRKNVMGRPILYGTTKHFLETFGLNSLEELPKLPTDAEAALSLTEEQRELLETKDAIEVENEEERED